MEKESAIFKKYLKLRSKKGDEKALKKSFKELDSIIITDENIDDIINYDTDIKEVLYLIGYIYNKSEKFIIKRPQFQKLITQLLEKRIIDKDYSIYVYNDLISLLRWYLEYDSTYFNYDENGADIILWLKKLAMQVPSERRYVEELIDDIQLDKFYNILDDILSNNKERNIKLLDDTFSTVNVLSSDFNNLLVYAIYVYNNNEKMLMDLFNKLLEAGVSPGMRNIYKQTYLHVLINKHNELINKEDFNSFVYYHFDEVLKKSIEYGYDVNANPSLLRTALEVKHILSYEIYEMLCSNGYDVTKDVDSINFLKENKNVVPNQYLIEESVDCRIVLDNMFLYLKKEKYEVEENLKKDLYDFEKEIYNFLRLLKGHYGNSDYALANEWGNCIIENRKRSINTNDGPVSTLELVEGLRTLINNVNEILNNNVDEFKEKVYSYKNNSRNELV